MNYLKFLLASDAFGAGDPLGTYIGLAAVCIYVAQLNTTKAPNCTRVDFDFRLRYEIAEVQTESWASEPK